MNFQYRVRQKDGTSCWILGKLEMVEDGDGELIAQSVFLDIDIRKRTEHQNQQLKELAEANSAILNMALEHTPLCEFYYYPDRRTCVIPDRTTPGTSAAAGICICRKALRMRWWRLNAEGILSGCTRTSTVGRGLPQPSF